MLYPLNQISLKSFVGLLHIISSRSNRIDELRQMILFMGFIYGKEGKLRRVAGRVPLVHFAYQECNQSERLITRKCPVKQKICGSALAVGQRWYVGMSEAYASDRVLYLTKLQGVTSGATPLSTCCA